VSVVPWITEPRKKMCKRGKCQRCANCVNDAWRRVHAWLNDEDREWLRQQVRMMDTWVGEPMSEWALNWHCEPSMTTYQRY
jgi:hypothetical protein